MSNEFSVFAIGKVEVNASGFVLKIDEKYKAALRELDGFTHINVLWWCHLLDSEEYRKVTVTAKPYKNAPEKMGIFATRSPVRPNPIALTPVTILHIDHEKGEILIPYIDAENDTPILDIKPYHPAVDRIKNVDVPQWCKHWPQWMEDSATFDWNAEFENAH